MEKEGLICKICKKNFLKSDLVRHARDIHQLYIRKNEKKIICGICEVHFNFYKCLEKHLFLEHNFTPKTERKVFLSIEGFQAYKKELEESQAWFFAPIRTASSKTYYICHLSRKFKSLKRRECLPQKLEKFNVTCPARIEMDYKRGFVESCAQLHHYGHSTCFNILKPKIKEIAAEIEKGKS